MLPVARLLLLVTGHCLLQSEASALRLGPLASLPEFFKIYDS